MNDWQLQFKAWYDEHYGGRMQSEFVRDSGLARSTWVAYLKTPVDLSRLSKKAKSSLYKITGLDCFKVEGVVENKDLNQPDLVKQTVSAFYELAQKLENFKVSPELREQLTAKLPKMDVGRLTALLHAVYKPKDDFDQWLMISGYVYQGERK